MLHNGSRRRKYVIAPSTLHAQLTIESIIIMDMDENEKIIRLVDQWDGHKLPNWFGASFLQNLNAKVTPWLICVPKPLTSM